MHTVRKRFLPLLYLLPLCSQAQADTEFQYSGFARLVGGYLNDKDAKYEGYENSFSAAEDSLLGLQGEALFTDTLSATIQLLAHSGDDRDSGVEWLYLTYAPTHELQIKAGQLRTPFFNLSDVLDVGFAYPYITPPQQVYSSFLFDRYRGISVSYNTTADAIRIGLETSWGTYNDDFIRIGEKVPTRVDEMYAVVVKIGYDNIELRSAYIIGDPQVDIPELSQLSNALSQYGFNESAKSLSTEGQVKVFQAGITYDNLRYFARAEIIQTRSDFLVAPDLRSHYLTVGLYQPPFTFHLTAAQSDTTYQSARNTIPTGIDPGLDFLSQSYNTAYASLPADNLRSTSIGARWDLQHNLAIKSEITWLHGEQGTRSFFQIEDPAAFDRKATLMSIAVEWVF